jgi:hypothetical protein
MKWYNWKDISVREASGGYHYLLQMRTRADGKKQFRNIAIDKGEIFLILIHGFQGIVEKILSI